MEYCWFGEKSNWKMRNDVRQLIPRSTHTVTPLAANAVLPVRIQMFVIKPSFFQGCIEKRSLWTDSNLNVVISSKIKSEMLCRFHILFSVWDRNYTEQDPSHSICGVNNSGSSERLVQCEQTGFPMGYCLLLPHHHVTKHCGLATNNLGSLWWKEQTFIYIG